jgi:hypothetical protein
MDMPLPLKFKKESLISSRTGKGRAAGPALKLWILSFMNFFLIGFFIYFQRQRRHPEAA